MKRAPRQRKAAGNGRPHTFGVAGLSRLRPLFVNPVVVCGHLGRFHFRPPLNLAVALLWEAGGVNGSTSAPVFFFFKKNTL